MEPYQYQKLSSDPSRIEIRLIELLPAERESDEIHINIKHAVLSDNPEYEALSYCWGSRTDGARIACDSGYIEVMRNLALALRRLRPKLAPDASASPRTIWADAICINQADIPERGVQVRHMRRIYGMAQQVLVWLDAAPNPEDDSVAMDMIRRLARADPVTQNPFSGFGWHGDVPHVAHDNWPKLSAFWRKDYFRRSWIVQEVVVGRHVLIHCGADDACLVTWDELVKAVRFTMATGMLHIFPSGNVISIGAIKAARDDFRTHGSSTRSALATLQLSRRCLATDARDYVFAFYGLIGEELGQLGVLPDYSMDARSLYIQLAVSMLERSGNLDLLSVPRNTSDSVVGNLPSWVPDWSQDCDTATLLRFEFGGRAGSDAFNASGPAVCAPLFDVGPGHARLGVQGAIVDEIAAVSRVWASRREAPARLGPVWTVFADQNRTALTVAAAEVSALGVARVHWRRKYFDDQAMLDVFWETCRAGWFPEGHAAAREAFYRFHKVSRVFRMAYRFRFIPILLCLSGRILLSHSLGLPIKPPFSEGADYVRHCDAKPSRRLARTKKGYIGLVPGASSVGDKIALLKGGKCPYVIQRRDGGWELLGDSFVHGMMKGELAPTDEAVWQTLWLI